MVSNEVKLNQALAKLQEANATKYAEVCAKLPTLICNIEAQLACVEEALTTVVKESNVLGLEDIEESKRDYPELFGVKPRTEVIKEHLVRPIKKSNGASHNGHGEAIVEVDRSNTKKEALVESVKAEFDGNEAAARSFLKLPAKGPEGLDKKQAQEYRFARAIGISEADAMVLAKLTTIKEVNNNPRY